MKIKTIKVLTKSFIKNTKEFSFSVALGKLYKDIPVGSWKRRRTFCENRVFRYINEEYGYVVDDCIKSFDDDGCNPIEQKYIWTMWWQGENNMPPIVQACYKQLKKISNGYSVVLITKDNYTKYIDVPNYIIEKVNNGIISFTHFSDIYRMELLYKYGGFWVDATVFLEKEPKDIFKLHFFTLHAPGMWDSFSKGDWSSFCLFFDHTKTFFTYCFTKLFFEYWKKQDVLIEYLLIDYFKQLICDRCYEVKKMFEQCPTNYDYLQLIPIINSTYQSDIWDVVFKSSYIQKLSYKRDFILFDENHDLTNYGYLINLEE